MTTAMAFLAVWLAAAQIEGRHLQIDEGAGGPLVSNAVTVEGTAAMEVKADAARLEYTIENQADSPADALAGLKNTRERFAKAVAAVTGLKVNVTFEPPQVARRDRKDMPAAFIATQKAVARLDYIPKDARDLDDYLARLAASVADSGVVPSGVPGPNTVFEVSAPDSLEEGLMADAVKDASKRSDLAAKALHRRLSNVRSAFFESFVTVNGRRVAFGSGEPVESATPDVTILYTVRVAYALEL